MEAMKPGAVGNADSYGATKEEGIGGSHVDRGGDTTIREVGHLVQRNSLPKGYQVRPPPPWVGQDGKPPLSVRIRRGEN